VNVSSEYGLHIEEIAREFGSSAEGISNRGVCPACNGGSSRESSLTVSRTDHRLFFKCHRASCGFAGSTTVLGVGGVQEKRRAPERIGARDRYDSLGKGPLPRGVEAYLTRKYHLTAEHMAKGELRWTSDYSSAGGGRLVLPVRDRNGEAYGFNVRSLDGQKPKSLLFAENLRGSWYPAKTKVNKLLLVEDQLSAIRASDRINTVALLGSYLHPALVDTISKQAYDTVYLALDKDAYKTSIKIALEHPALKLQLPMLVRDLKDMGPHELDYWVATNCGVGDVRP